MAIVAPALVARMTDRGLAIELAPLCARLGGQPALRRILASLTTVEKVVPGAGRGRAFARTKRAAYEIDRGAGLLYIPRVKGAAFTRASAVGGACALVDAIVDERPPVACRAIAAADCVAEEPLYGYQTAIVDHICAKAAEGPFTFYLQLDTGLGKTRVGCALVAQRAQPALVVVPTEAIAFQWLDELAASYPGLRGAIFRAEEERKALAAAAAGRRARPAANPLDHDLVVIIVNSFRVREPDFTRGYGTVILDEAHELHSAHNSRALWLAQAPLVVGLSATPLERPDGLDRYVTLHLGAPVRSTDLPGGATTDVNFRGEVRLVEYSGRAGAPECETVLGPAGTMSAILTIGSVLSDAARRRMVAEEVRRLLHAHETWPAAELARCGLGPDAAGTVRRHGVFVFAELREALPALRDELERVLGRGAVLAPELDGRARHLSGDE